MRRPNVPEHLRSWLFDPRSLTRRLCRACHGEFRVQLLSQAWGSPTASERRALSMEPRERALVREVLLLCRGVPWVFARSVFPRRTLTGGQRRMARLGERPLGRVLFTTPGMRRLCAVVEPAGADGSLMARCLAAVEVPPRGAWERTSVFVCRERPLLVREVFLDEFARD